MLGVNYVTVRRWLVDGKIRPSVAVPYDGRTLWRWTSADVGRARKMKAAQRPGPKPKKGA